MVIVKEKRIKLELVQSLQGHKGLQIMIVFIFSSKSVSENSSWHIYIGKTKHM